MTLFSGWVVIFISLGLAVVLFVMGQVGPAGLHYNGDKVRCFDGKHWVQDDHWYTAFSIWRIEWRYHPANYDCNTKYDPATMTKNGPLPDTLQ